MVGTKIGGINVFGGGLPLYIGTNVKQLVGGVGVSGDTSWRRSHDRMASANYLES